MFLMRLVLTVFLLWSGVAVSAASAKVVKVLPHLLDWEGKSSLSPSLYERDAYQAYLRGNLKDISGVRFDVQWKARSIRARNYVLRLEIKGNNTEHGKPWVKTQTVTSPKFMSKWSAIPITKEEYFQMGQIIAWRVTIWDGESQIGEQKSFLW